MENKEELSPEQTLKDLLEKAKELANKQSIRIEEEEAEDGAKNRNIQWKKWLDQIEKTLETIPDAKKEAEADAKTLHLAITMAGAISAGAYTAGVIDYLLEVLDRWSELKDLKDPRVPTHNIKIEVLSGASAGGITAAITSVALHRRDRHSIKSYNPEEEEKHNAVSADDYNSDRRKLNRLYNAWVNLSAREMMSVLLQGGDFVTLTGGKQSCISVLNSEFVDKIANSTVKLSADDKASRLPDYVSSNLRMFVTLTNLSGFEKKIEFQQTGDAQITVGQNFIMTDHRDAVLFRFADYANHRTENDGSIWVKFEDDDYGTEILQKAAMATGAFPIGLAYRIFPRQLHHVQNNVLLKKLHGQNFRLGADDINDNKYYAAFIDGGLINNEPFELTKWLLQRQVKNDRLINNPDNFNSTILMIDPFPTEIKDNEKLFSFDDEADASYPFNLLGAANKFFSVLRKQVLVKHGIIEDAFNRNNYSCFVIAPSRHSRRKDGSFVKHNGSRAIASGTLGGFGGFVAKEFREHDFYLGRLNCKSFLQKHFRIPAETKNPIFKDAFSDKAKEIFIITDEETGEKFLPIIPDVKKLDDGAKTVKQLYKELLFPAYSPAKFKSMRPHLTNRLKHIFDNNFDFSAMKWYERPFAKMYLKTNLKIMRRFFFNQLSEMITRDLDLWELNSDRQQRKK